MVFVVDCGDDLPKSLSFTIIRFGISPSAKKFEFYQLCLTICKSNSNIIGTISSHLLKFADLQEKLDMTIEIPFSINYLNNQMKLRIILLGLNFKMEETIIYDHHYDIFDEKSALLCGNHIFKVGFPTNTDYSFRDDKKICDIMNRLNTIKFQNIIFENQKNFLDDLMIEKLNKKIYNFSKKKHMGFIEIDFPLFIHKKKIKKLIFRPVQDSNDQISNISEIDYGYCQLFDPLLDKESSCAIVAHRLSRNSTTNDDIEPNYDEIQILELLCNNVLMHHVPAESDLDLVWKFRQYLAKKSEYLRFLLLSINHLTLEDKSYRIIYKWKHTDKIFFLILILEFINVPYVEKYVVDNLNEIANEKELDIWFPQFLSCIFNHGLDPFCEKLDYLIKECNEDPKKLIKELQLDQCSNLVIYLIKKSLEMPLISSNLIWSLKYLESVSSMRKEWKKLNLIRKTLITCLSYQQHDMMHGQIYIIIQSQRQFFALLCNLFDKACNLSPLRKNRVKIIKNYIEAEQQNRTDHYFTFYHSIIDENFDIYAHSFIPNSFHIFNSKLMPIMFDLRLSNNKLKRLIFKGNDDVRIDCLVLQMIQIIDMILLEKNIDLKFTNYKVFPINIKRGLIEYVESSTLSKIKQEHLTIRNYFNYLVDKTSYTMQELMDNYTKSVAGYSLATFIFGIGDRHMENLMLRPNGQFFHIDFSFILGQDPKPWPAPMRLNSFMIDGMGGLGSKHFLQFSRHIYLSFMCLQKSSQILLGSFQQLGSTTCNHIIPMSCQEALERIENNLLLGKNEETSTRYIEGIVKKSIAAVMPELMEKFHNFAQFWTG